MGEIVFNLSQAVSLLAIVPCLVVIFYILIFSRNIGIVLIPTLCFLCLISNLGSVFFLKEPISSIGFYSKFLIETVSNFLAAFIYLLVIQLIVGKFPRPKSFMILAIPALGEIFKTYCAYFKIDHLTFPPMTVIDFMSLYNVFGSLFILALLTIYVSREFIWKAGHSSNSKHKYWLLINIIVFNVVMVAFDLVQISGKLPMVNYSLIDASITAGFIYLVISSMFRVFTDEFYYKLVSKHFEKPMYSNMIKETVSRISKYMEDEKPYREPGFNREALARKLNIQEVQLSFIINSSLNKSFTELANEYRVRDAKKMLEETDKAVTAICYDTGFNSLTSFNRVFKNSTNLSPTDYRAKYQLNVSNSNKPNLNKTNFL